MVSINGKTCRLITSVSPPNVKKAFSLPAVKGRSCWSRPRFCIKSIQPIDAIYGGVINGIIKMMSKALYLARISPVVPWNVSTATPVAAVKPSAILSARPAGEGIYTVTLPERVLSSAVSAL